MTTSVIRNELLSTLQSITAVPAIKEEGENFKPKNTDDYPFARFTFLPRESVQDDISTGAYQLGGLARIDLFYNRGLNNITTAIEMAETIVAAYEPEIIQLTGVQLTIVASWFEAARHEPSATNIPIFVRWVAYS